MIGSDRFSAGDQRLKWLGPLLLLALVLTVYGRTLTFGFTGADDYGLLVEGHDSLVSQSSIARAFQTDAFAAGTTMYRPMLTVSFILDTIIGRGDPFFYHLTNLLIHFLACLALLLFLRAVGSSPGVALVTAGIFAVHPALTMAVAWIPGRNDLLLGLFVLSACWSLAEYLHTRGGQWLAIHCLSAAAALFTKENGVSAFMIYLLLAFSILGHRAVFRRRHSALFAAWLLILLNWMLMREAAVGLNYTAHRAHLLSVGQMTSGVLGYLGKLFWPGNLRPLPGAAAADWSTGIIAITVFTLCTMLGRIENKKLFAVGLCWYLLILLPATVFMYTGELLFFEHRQYLAAAGLLLAFSQLRPVRRVDIRRWRTAVILCLLVCAFGQKAYWYSLTFINRVVFWKTAMMTSPSSAMANAGYGNFLALRGEYRQAEEQLLEALRKEPENSHFIRAYRNIRLQMDQDGAPADLSARSAPEKPRLVSPANLLERAITEHRRWQLAQAIVDYRAYLVMRPRDARAHYLTGLASAMQEQWDQAAISYRRALLLGLAANDRADAWYNLGDIYINWNMPAQAQEAKDSSRLNTVKGR